VERGTGYGVRKPPEPRGEAYYLLLAGEAGFRHLGTSRSGQVLLLDFVKDR